MTSVMVILYSNFKMTFYHVKCLCFKQLYNFSKDMSFRTNFIRAYKKMLIK